MSILPAFRAALDKGLNKDRITEIAADIKNMDGVYSVGFFEKDVELIVTHQPGKSVRDDVRKMPGVIGIKNQL